MSATKVVVVTVVVVVVSVMEQKFFKIEIIFDLIELCACDEDIE